MTTNSLNHGNSSGCWVISSLQHLVLMCLRTWTFQAQYLCSFKGRQYKYIWAGTSSPQFLFWKRSCKDCSTCRSQPSQAGQTCIQSAYQLVITTVVKKEQKAKLEVRKISSVWLWEIRVSSTFSQRRAMWGYWKIGFKIKKYTTLCAIRQLIHRKYLYFPNMVLFTF